MPAYYVTATGTDIGKTYVAGALLQLWRLKGLSVFATKPVMTGFGETELLVSDCGNLLEAMGQACTAEAVSEMCHTRLAPPLAPNVAMRQAGLVQDYADILRFVQHRLEAPSDLHLVEGAGGVMSPLTDTKLQIDLMVDLGLPVILITAAYLGSVSHTLTAIDALQGRGLVIEKVIVSQVTKAHDEGAAFIGEIERFRAVSCHSLPHGVEFSEFPFGQS